jgi:hypothetical protein
MLENPRIIHASSGKPARKRGGPRAKMLTDSEHKIAGNRRMNVCRIDFKRDNIWDRMTGTSQV